jgi:GT2 family glycosyltransferase
MPSSAIPRTSERLPGPVTVPVAASGASLLLPMQPESAGLDFDQFQRYPAVAARLDRLLSGLPAPVRVLDVGANVLNPWALFFDPERVCVTRCDIEPLSQDPDFVVIDKDKPLPFADESFDAVVALEVLEHLPAGGRRDFLADCLRVARRGAVFTCPNGTPEVAAAEALANAAYRQRHGRPHPFLHEHEEFGLPREEDILALLQELDCPHAVFDNAQLGHWLPELLLAETVKEKQPGPAVQTALLGRWVRFLLHGQLGPAGGIPYRKVYVCAKTFEATAALQPPPAEVVDGAVPACTQDVSAEALNALARLSVEVLGGLEEDYQTEAALRKAETATLREELVSWRQQFTIAHSLLTSITRSGTWRLLAPLRAVRHLLAPRGFDARALLPWQQLEPLADAPPETWLALGNDPQFLVPCWFPAGWVRFRLKLSSPAQGRVELYADTGEGFTPAACVERLNIGPGGVDREFFTHFAGPVRAVRLDPLDVEGEFRLELFQAQAVPWPVALARACAGKLTLLCRHHRLGRSLRRGLVLLLTGRLRQVLQRLAGGLAQPLFMPPERHQVQAYRYWQQHHRLTDADRTRMREEAVAMSDPPLISVLMPVYNGPEPYLSLAIESVLRQTYPHWELCIADDASTAPHVRRVLEKYAAREPRIRLTYRPRRGNISAASNSALALATGEYVALLDQDDELAEHALLRMAQAIAGDRGLDMVYSDEDKLEQDGRRSEPFFKPDWSPEYFLTCMYTCHLGVYRTALVREVGGFRSEYDTAQDYDLALRIVARTSRIAHIPDILYHWRKLVGSTALSHGGKPQAAETARRALASYLKIIGQKGAAEPGPLNGHHRVRFAITGRPKVSIVIPTASRGARIRGKETTYIAMCVESIRRRSSYKAYEIIVVDNDDMPPGLRQQLDRWRVRRVTFAEPFNLASKINLGATKACGDHLVLLNDDIEVIAADWLECMLEYSQQPAVGAVGARLLFPDGRLQHVGVTIQGGNPTHPYYGNPAQDVGYGAGNVLVRNYSAVTGACLMTRMDVWQELGGFDEAFPLNYNDVDYCLRLIESGRRVVYTPYAELYHHEGASKEGLHQRELEAFQARWGTRWAHDPYFNPNLSNRFHDYRIKTAEELKEEG